MFPGLPTTVQFLITCSMQKLGCEKTGNKATIKLLLVLLAQTQTLLAKWAWMQIINWAQTQFRANSVPGPVVLFPGEGCCTLMPISLLLLLRRVPSAPVDTQQILCQAKLEVWVEIVSVSVLWKTISYIPRLGLHLVSFPDYLIKWKEGLHGVLSDTLHGGTTAKKNVVIAFDIWDSSILTA